MPYLVRDDMPYKRGDVGAIVLREVDNSLVERIRSHVLAMRNSKSAIPFRPRIRDDDDSHLYRGLVVWFTRFGVGPQKRDPKSRKDARRVVLGFL